MVPPGGNYDKEDLRGYGGASKLRAQEVEVQMGRVFNRQAEWRLVGTNGFCCYPLEKFNLR
jgi:hypothetical protein